VANKEMVFKSRQGVILLNVSASRVNPGGGVSLQVIPILEESGPGREVSTISPAHPAESERISA
jgi:hypothetical protein